MSQERDYSPQIRRDLVFSKLYLEAKSFEIPMTHLVNQIVAEKLGQYQVKRIVPRPRN
ncbi:MAG: hypothetical protein H0X34_01865 [Chthoniobacterales bacterium]|nr:hypothetical protein [Chthoniobacterales bacterium]